MPGADQAARGDLEDHPRRSAWSTTQTNEPRGEYVLVDGRCAGDRRPEQELTLEQAAQRALELTGQGFGPTAAAKAAAQGTPYSKSEVYKQLLVLQGPQAARMKNRNGNGGGLFSVTKLLVPERQPRRTRRH